MSSWLWMALISAILWGIHYPLVEKILDDFNPLTVMFIAGVVFVVTIPFLDKGLFSNLTALTEMSVTKWVILVGMMLTQFLAIYFGNKALSAGNATYVSLIEISYPIFVIIFSYLLFKQVDLNLPVVLGGALIIAGVGGYNKLNSKRFFLCNKQLTLIKLISSKLLLIYFLRMSN